MSDKPLEPSAQIMSLRSGATLLAFTVVFTGLMAASFELTREKIEASIQAEKQKQIDAILPATRYDNALLDDAVLVPANAALGNSDPVRVLRARKAGQPVALVLEAAAPDGYSGRIGLILAMGQDGLLSGVRVTEHKETPGLGDYIDPQKDRNKTRPWITQFDGKGIGQIALEKWKVRKDGGQFDYMTGATISARAVTHAVGRALDFAARNQERLFSAPSGSSL